MNAKTAFGFIVFFLSFISFGQIDSSNLEKRPIQNFEEIVISSNYKQIVFEDSKHYIVDFEVNHHGHFLLLKKLRNYQLCRLDELLTTQLTLNLNFKPTSFHMDCMGNLHVLSKDSMYQINTLNDELSIYEVNSIQLYEDFYKNCTGKSGRDVYMESDADFGHTKIFYTLNEASTQPNVIYEIQDSVAAKDAHTENMEINANTYLEKRRTDEITINELGETKDHAERIFFFQQVLTQTDYNPMFVQHDTSYIFDHTNGYAVQLGQSGDVQNKTEITYHQDKDWTTKNLQDVHRKTFYAVFEEKGIQYLYELSPDDFQLGRKIEITEHSYPKKLIIYDGYVYYTYKENYGANLNKLYRQRL